MMPAAAALLHCSNEDSEAPAVARRLLAPPPLPQGGVPRALRCNRVAIDGGSRATR
jgi:hypothetical protein